MDQTHEASEPDYGVGRSEVPVVLVAPTELKVANRMEFAEKISKAALQFRHVVVDFSECTSIDPASLGVLVRLHRQLAEMDCTLTFARCGEDIRGLFTLTRMHGFFNIRSDDLLEPGMS